MAKNARIKTLLVGMIVSICLSVPAAEKEDLSVLSEWMAWKNAPMFLRQSLNDQADAYLDKRKQVIEQLKTAEDWQNRQKQVTQKLQDILGPFPEKTPLNPKVTGVTQKNGYRIEKILFESMPQFYVTGCLFIPDHRTGKTPAILNPIGHTDIAFRAPLYLQVILNLVKKGFIVFAIDPLGQGERLQYYDPDKKDSLVGGSTTEHTHFGRQCFLNGVSNAKYFIWDGIRAIDYLLTRDEVDPQRIAVTGLSGGGTQTAYFSAIDDRVRAAAPTCYITSFHRLLESIGPQDAEQNMVREISSGLDHADFIEVRAPKPTLILAMTRDFFSIQGTRETYEEVKRAFSALGVADNLQMAEDDFTHGYSKKNREALYAFMQKHLLLPGDPQDEEIELPTQAELTVTTTGQILTAVQSKRVFDFNRIETQKNLDQLQKRRENVKSHLSSVLNKAVQISGYQAPPKSSPTVFRGGFQHEGYRIEKYVLAGEGPCIVPLLMFVPTTAGPFTPVLILRPEGKDKDAIERGFVENLLKNQCLVVSADLSGLGEVGDSVSGIPAPFTGLLIGRSLPGIHAGEIVRIAQFMKTNWDIKKDQLTVIAFSHLSPALLHAAAFEPSLSRIALVQPLISYESVAMNLLYKTPGWIEVPGALQAYDLPDLAACIAPRPLLILSPTNSMLNPASDDEIQKGYSITKNAYQSLGKDKNFTVMPNIQNDAAIQSKIIEWVKSF